MNVETNMHNLHKHTILLVEDTPPLAHLYEAYLTEEKYNVVVIDCGQKALTELDIGTPQAIVLDLLLPDINGLEVLTYARKLYPDLPIIVVTVTNSVNVAVEAMRLGAYDYIVKPFPPQRLTITLNNALERRELANEVKEWRQLVGQGRFYNFVGQSSAMQAIYRTIDAVGPSKVSVFIKGENGTGKELAAQAIHEASPRRNKPFIALNCAAIPRDLMESTIFGHIKGAFTGAVSDHMGAARSANGGTLFLDEICELPLEMQTKLLRFAQTGEVLPVGSNKVDYVDVRILSATNRDPVNEILNKRFREDLYYRLHVVPIDMPALRERDDDVLYLALHFMTRFNAEENKQFIGLDPEVMGLFRSYDWPGNVRQLENVIRNVIVLNDGARITMEMMPKDLKTFAAENPIPAANQNLPPLSDLEPTLDDDALIKPLWQTERDAIMSALAHTGDDIARAAILLEVSTSTIYRKLSYWRSLESPSSAVTSEATSA